MKTLNKYKACLSGALIATAVYAPQVYAMGNDDPWLSKFNVDKLQYFQEGGNNAMAWEVDWWLGQDLSKLWIKTAGEYVDSEEEAGVESGNVQFVYSRAISPFWDWQAGLRHDFEPEVDGDKRNWVSFGFLGTGYNFWEVDTSLFVGEESSTQLRLELEREYMITQKWVLTPIFEFIVNGTDNEKYGEGSGLSLAEFSLRLGYEPNRQFQPYIGITASQTFGNTRDYREAEGEEGGNFSAIVGVHFWL